MKKMKKLFSYLFLLVLVTNVLSVSVFAQPIGGGLVEDYDVEYIDIPDDGYSFKEDIWYNLQGLVLFRLDSFAFSDDSVSAKVSMSNAENFDEGDQLIYSTFLLEEGVGFGFKGVKVDVKSPEDLDKPVFYFSYGGEFPETVYGDLGEKVSIKEFDHALVYKNDDFLDQGIEYIRIEPSNINSRSRCFSTHGSDNVGCMEPFFRFDYSVVLSGENNEGVISSQRVEIGLGESKKLFSNYYIKLLSIDGEGYDKKATVIVYGGDTIKGKFGQLYSLNPGEKISFIDLSNVLYEGVFGTDDSGKDLHKFKASSNRDMKRALFELGEYTLVDGKRILLEEIYEDSVKISYGDQTFILEQDTWYTLFDGLEIYIDHDADYKGNILSLNGEDGNEDTVNARYKVNYDDVKFSVAAGEQKKYVLGDKKYILSVREGDSSVSIKVAVNKGSSVVSLTSKENVDVGNSDVDIYGCQKGCREVEGGCLCPKIKIKKDSSGFTVSGEEGKDVSATSIKIFPGKSSVHAFKDDVDVEEIPFSEEDELEIPVNFNGQDRNVKIYSDKGNLETVIDVDNYKVKTRSSLVTEKSGLYADVSSGKKHIKVLPSVASEKAREVLGDRRSDLELKEVGSDVKYVSGTIKKYKVLGLIPVNAKAEVAIDAETADVEKSEPWFASISTK